MSSAAQGNFDTAWLLLERAARLAPHDARIAANLAALREYRAATPRGPVVATPRTGRPAPPPLARSEPTLLSAPPAVWAPARQ